MKSCIAVLTRGYSDITKYSMLIKRNQHISANLKDNTIDILIFHEGNINEEHQKYIKRHTRDLEIKFINISTNAFKKEKALIPFERAHDFLLGYRNMCSFWFVDFWHFVKDYDSLLRIDEDCYVNFNIDNIFIDLQEFLFITGIIQDDEPHVTDGLNPFTLDFIKENSTYKFKELKPKDPPSGPYTNIIGISLKDVRENEIFIKYVKEIDSSNMIYKRRWGDLPLWGEVIHYIFGSDSMKIDTGIRYLHDSHHKQVN